jgi:hypothetical protein
MKYKINLLVVQKSAGFFDGVTIFDAVHLDGHSMSPS